MKILILVLFCSLILQDNCHYIEHIDGGNVSISSYTNQAKQIEIPFKKCFEVKAELQANLKYVRFQASSLKLSKQSEGQVNTDNKLTMLDNLRSSQSNSHKNLLVFDDYIITFLPPQTIQIIEGKNKFEIVNSFNIHQINSYTQFKMYRYQNKGLLIIYASGE